MTGMIIIFIATPIAWYSLDNWISQFDYRTTISGWVFIIVGCSALAVALLTVSLQNYPGRIAESDQFITVRIR